MKTDNTKNGRYIAGREFKSIYNEINLAYDGGTGVRFIEDFTSAEGKTGNGYIIQK